MSYIEKSLSADEEIRGIFKFHWIVWANVYAWSLVAALSWGTSFNYPLVGYIGATTAIGVTFYEFLRIRTIEQGVTDKRVIQKVGIISRKSEEMKHTSIETVEIDQSIVGRMMGYGTVAVTGRGVSDVIFKRIDDPMSVKRAIEGATAAKETTNNEEDTEQDEAA